MNLTNDFIAILLNNRERIVDKLLQNYSYAHLLKLFSEINIEKDASIKIMPNNKHLFRLLSGSFDGSKYDKSSIDWIPSKELVDGIVSLAQYFNINHIEEIYTGMGILSALLTETNGTNISITAADTFENIETCNKLGSIPIAKRDINDFKYYEQLNEPYPEMIISSYYPANNFTKNNKNNVFVEEMTSLIQSNNHKIIVMILPHTFTHFYDLFYHLMINNEYTINTYYVKAFDKYFYLSDLMKTRYPSSMVAHVLVKTNIFPKNTTSFVEKNNLLCEILGSSIISSDNIDKHCTFAKWLNIFYDNFSSKMIKSIYRIHNFTKPLSGNKKVKELIDYFVLFDKKSIHTFPQYIYDIDEFLFWAKCVEKNLFFVFDNRLQFYTVYTQSISVENSEVRQNINFPSWIQTLDSMYKYIYLDNTQSTHEWNESCKQFYITFDTINTKNRKIIFDS